MVDKYVVDPQASDQKTMAELTQKLNEVIDTISSNQVSLAARRPLVPGPTQHAEYLEMMAKRLESGPFKTLSAAEPHNDLVKAIGTALTAFQAAVQAYKETLGESKPTPEG